MTHWLIDLLRSTRRLGSDDRWTILRIIYGPDADSFDNNNKNASTLKTQDHTAQMCGRAWSAYQFFVSKLRQNK